MTTDDLMVKAFEAAFAEWHRRAAAAGMEAGPDWPCYTADHYGRVCAAELVAILNDLAKGEPWAAIGFSRSA